MPDRTTAAAEWDLPECVIRECEPEYIRTVPYRIQYGHAPYRSIMRLMACWCADSQLGPRGLVVAPKAKK
jgi:hypothetical protein